MMSSLQERMKSQGIPHSVGQGNKVLFLDINGKIKNHGEDEAYIDDGGPGSGNCGHRGRLPPIDE